MTRALCLVPCLFAASLARAEGEQAIGAEAEPHHSPFEMRVSVESPLYGHASDGTTNIVKETELEPNVMVSYVLEEQRISFDLELGESFVVQSVGDDAPRRTGTTIRPGIAYSLSPPSTVFVTAMFPIHLEPSPVVLSLRLGAGINMLRTPLGTWFLEADVDLPLAGAMGAPDAFSEQAVVLATGLLFHVPG
jgi:hypothetical protein